MGLKTSMLFSTLILTMLQPMAFAASVKAEFIYRGHLNDGNAALPDGVYDFVFSLHDQPTGGRKVGNDIARQAVAVRYGDFAVTLDFGRSAFDGNARYLEVAVRPAGRGSYSTQIPRHAVVAVPYALHADTASKLAGETKGNVGIGTDQPKNRLHVAGDVIEVDSAGPSLWLKETDQQIHRPDYGYWRIIADQNALFFEVWENPRGTAGNEFDVQDEFLSFHRGTPRSPSIGNHIIQWNYDFLSQGVRDVKIGANWANAVQPQTPRVLSLVALNDDTNSLVEAVRVIPNKAWPIVVLPSGRLGIGTNSPSNVLTVKQGAGRPVADGWNTYSSRRGKTNIKPIANAIEKVSELQGVTYNHKSSRQVDIGLIAEDVGKVIPEIVEYEVDGANARSVDYARLVPVLVEAIKQQQKQIDKQQAEIGVLLKRLEDLTLSVGTDSP